MNKPIRFDAEYNQWIAKVSQRFRRYQIKAAASVNQTMLAFYWSLGKDIASLHAESKRGTSFFDTLSKDLQSQIPDVKSFSASNLRYMKRFYEMFSGTARNLPQVGEDLDNEPAIEANLPQPVEDLSCLPWGHVKLLIDKCHTNPAKARFYARQSIENNWSRAMLTNFLDTDLYERQGKAITNFSQRLPSAQSELARELTKDPYNFDFLTIRKDYDEKELKDALMSSLQRFLLELGTGFAFVGREYRIVIGHTEVWLDMLFYNILLHCYVVVEVKVSDFDPRDIGQLGTYVSAVDHILKREADNPTIGLLICKTKDKILAQYALDGSANPLGISEYKLSKVFMDDFKGTMPTIEEIERGLSDGID